MPLWRFSSEEGSAEVFFLRWVFLSPLCKKSQSGFMSIHQTEEDHMKKTLHGRRHLRARASVQAGREKRAYRKMQREIQLFNSIDWFAIGRAMARTMEIMLEAVTQMGPIIHRIARDIRVDEIIKKMEADRGLS
jgi:hypothetical protein